MILRNFLVAAVCVSALAPILFGGMIAYVSTGPSLSGIPASLGTVDMTTGAYTQIGPTVLVAGDINQLQDIAIDSNGKRGASRTSSSLNPFTAAATPIGSLTGQLASVNALVFGANNTLYASGQGELYTINTSTGAATPVGATTDGTVTYGSTGDLAFINGMLYMTTPAAVGQGTGDRLVVVNPNTGATTLLGATGFTDIDGLAFVGGTLYGFPNISSSNVLNNGPQLISLNLTNGQGSLVPLGGGDPNSYIFDGHLPITGAASSIPEPGTLLLSGAGLLGTMIVLRRRAIRAGA